MACLTTNRTTLFFISFHHFSVIFSTSQASSLGLFLGVSDISSLSVISRCFLTFRHFWTLSHPFLNFNADLLEGSGSGRMMKSDKKNKTGRNVMTFLPLSNPGGDPLSQLRQPNPDQQRIKTRVNDTIGKDLPGGRRSSMRRVIPSPPQREEELYAQSYTRSHTRKDTYPLIHQEGHLPACTTGRRLPGLYQRGGDYPGYTREETTVYTPM